MPAKRLSYLKHRKNDAFEKSTRLVQGALQSLIVLGIKPFIVSNISAGEAKETEEDR